MRRNASMQLHEFRQSQILRIPLAEAWAFFSQPANLNEITPPDMRFEVAGGDMSSIYAGQVVWYRLQLLPGLYRTWVTEIRHVQPQESFIDEQRFGPYRFWQHRHSFKEVSPTQTEVSDHVIYALPFWPFGEVVHTLYVKPMHEKVFRYRREALVRRFSALD
ncbi:Ligand-binding SRPBCC domain-containing protein [Prosthecobacter debontii]|uniref:Ligand-binding SRPBCC domain-containing protein n=2 Tax=Prosthecobacter debontii TaxID=48467 RepID=A0A1T4X8N0_9BACT|nr:Ligand-binding SRPBCC domain-containing protein [Prosthecobacter debontii]